MHHFFGQEGLLNCALLIGFMSRGREDRRDEYAIAGKTVAKILRRRHQSSLSRLWLEKRNWLSFPWRAKHMVRLLRCWIHETCRCLLELNFLLGSRQWCHRRSNELLIAHVFQILLTLGLHCLADRSNFFPRRNEKIFIEIYSIVYLE